MTQKPTLCIGDVHGHYDRLLALLEQEGIIAWNNEIKDHERINHDVEVVQLGDLGHFGEDGSPTGDEFCWMAAKDGWIDTVLWGNHDRAVIHGAHHFTKYHCNNEDVFHSMFAELVHQGRLKLAHVAHDWLLTHAGLHAAFKYQKDVPEGVKEDPQVFADWMNEEDVRTIFEDLEKGDPNVVAIRDCVGTKRGGKSPCGGILWRDHRENRYMPFKQVFGHTKGAKVRHDGRGETAWNVDVGTQNNGRLAGIWLPEQRVVGVDVLQQNFFEGIV